MKPFLILGGLFLIIFVCTIPLNHHIDEYKTQKNGQLINTIITYVPNCIGTKTRHFLKFKYNGKIYSKDIGRPCEEYKIGDKLILKHIDGTTVFLYENEKIEKEFISFGILAALGLFFIFYGLKKK